LLTIAWFCFIGYQAFLVHRRDLPDALDIVIFTVISFGVLLSLIRRERIEIYSDQMVWRKTYFGITRSNAAPLADVLGAEWNEGEERGRGGKGPDYVEFYLANGSVKACYGFKFNEFDRMRQDISTMYPELVKRWGRSTVRSKNLTLLNLS
jgi:hypothetical protein